MKRRVTTSIYPEKARPVSRRDESESVVVVYAEREYGGPFVVRLRVNTNGAISLDVEESGAVHERRVYERKGVPQREGAK
jgi:hypothetical protein